MRRSASEVIRNLEMRIARLERQASNRTASAKIEVSINTGSPRNSVKVLTVKQLLSLVKFQGLEGRRQCQVNIVPDGSRSKVNFICHSEGVRISDVQWSCSVDMYDLINAIEADHPRETEALLMNANVMDDGDADAMAVAVQDWLGTSRGTFGGGLGRGWFVHII